jgi:hypothetical protein
MSIRKFLEAQPLFEMESYSRKEERTRDAVRFTGSPRKHPYDGEKMLLVIDPAEESIHFYEFIISDIVYYEQISNIVSDSGRTIPMARIYLPKGCIGIEFRPFKVDDPPVHFTSFDHLHEAMEACGETN